MNSLNGYDCGEFAQTTPFKGRIAHGMLIGCPKRK